MNDRQVDNIRNVKNFIGLLLVLMGAGIGLWVFFSAYSIFQDPERLGAFQGLISGGLDSGMIGDEREMELVIPPEFLAYIIPIALLSIAAGVAGVFITGGVKLLDSDLQLLSRRFNTFKHQVSTMIENFTNSLNKNKDRNS